MKCKNCKRSPKACICERVDAFFARAAGTPRQKPQTNVVYASFEVKGSHRILRLPDTTRRLAC